MDEEEKDHSPEEPHSHKHSHGEETHRHEHEHQSSGRSFVFHTRGWTIDRSIRRVGAIVERVDDGDRETER